MSHRLSISSSCSRPSRSTLAGTAGGWSRCRWNGRKGRAIHSVSRWHRHPVSSTPARPGGVVQEKGIGDADPGNFLRPISCSPDASTGKVLLSHTSGAARTVWPTAIATRVASIAAFKTCSCNKTAVFWHSVFWRARHNRGTIKICTGQSAAEVGRLARKQMLLPSLALCVWRCFMFEIPLVPTLN